MRKSQIKLMMALMLSCGAAGVTMAGSYNAAPPPDAALSQQPLSNLLDQVKSGSCPEDVQKEMISRIRAMSELSQENVDALAEALSSRHGSLTGLAKVKIKELCMKILQSNQLGQLLRDSANGSGKVLARKKVEMLFKYCNVDVTQANLVELAPSMKEFQDNIRADDPAAKALDHCYYGHHNKYDLRDCYPVWQKKSVEELKAELKILQDITEDHTVYDWVKWFYKKVQTDLINEIILKEPGFYDDPMLRSKKHSISEKAKKAVDAWEKKKGADEKTAKESEKEAESKRRKNISMLDLVNEFEQGYRHYKYADAEIEFKEREFSEREILEKDYQSKSFDDLVKLHKNLCAEKKKYQRSSDASGLYRLHNHWITIQRDEAEDVILEKLNDAKPENYQALYDDNYDDNYGFSNKIYSAFQKRKDQIKATLVQTYQNMSDAERSKLVKKLGKEVRSKGRMKKAISRLRLEALAKVKKNQTKNASSDKGVAPEVLGLRSSYNSESTASSTYDPDVAEQKEYILDNDEWMAFDDDESWVLDEAETNDIQHDRDEGAALRGRSKSAPKKSAVSNLRNGSKSRPKKRGRANTRGRSKSVEKNL